jgi:acyl-CoA synthetase (AMP-forming)/AMP-acid ligase II
VTTHPDAQAKPTVYDYLAHWANQTPEAPAYFFGEHTACYAELSDQVDRLARALLARGIQPGDRVAMLSTPRPEAWISFLATTSIGAVWVGLNPRYRDRELSHVLENSRPALILGLRRHNHHQLAGALTRVAAGLGAPSPVLFDDLDELTQSIAEPGGFADKPQLAARRSGLDPGRPGLIVYTSGSTGAPKGAVLSDRGIAVSFAIQARHQMAKRIRNIANLPVNHIAGIGDLCCTPLVVGGSTVFQEQFDPEAIIDAIEAQGVTVLMQVPTMLKLLAEHPRWASADLSSLEAVHWGGAPLPDAVTDAYRAREIHLGSTYGMTEITGSITYTDPDADPDTLASTVGRPIPEEDLRIVDGNGERVAAGETGQVTVRHPGLLLEYFDAPEATRAAFDADGYFRTGDMGLLLADGNLRLVGRKHEIYKSGGENIYPREIELVLESHPGVRMAAVVATPDPVYDEVGVAYCETEQDSETTPELLESWCRERLANYKVPKAFLLTGELPRLPVGKVDKQELARRASHDLAASATSETLEPGRSGRGAPVLPSTSTV